MRWPSPTSSMPVSYGSMAPKRSGMSTTVGRRAGSAQGEGDERLGGRALDRVDAADPRAGRGQGGDVVVTAAGQAADRRAGPGRPVGRDPDGRAVLPGAPDQAGGGEAAGPGGERRDGGPRPDRAERDHVPALP